MPIHNPVLKKTYQAIAALTGIFALVLQLYLIIKNVPSTGLSYTAEVIRFFSYMTILSNLLVTGCFVFLLIANNTAAGIFFRSASVQAAIFLYIFIVGVLYHFILSGLQSLTGLPNVADKLLHYFMPVLYCLYWIFFAEKKSLPYSNIFKWILFPLVYIVYTMIRGAVTNLYPYPFLDVPAHGYAAVILNIVMVTVAYFLIGLTLIFLNNRLFVNRTPITL